jgi:hypothetical protein
MLKEAATDVIAETRALIQAQARVIEELKACVHALEALHTYRAVTAHCLPRQAS